MILGNHKFSFNHTVREINVVVNAEDEGSIQVAKSQQLESTVQLFTPLKEGESPSDERKPIITESIQLNRAIDRVISRYLLFKLVMASEYMKNLTRDERRLIWNDYLDKMRNPLGSHETKKLRAYRRENSELRGVINAFLDQNETVENTVQQTEAQMSA